MVQDLFAQAAKSVHRLLPRGALTKAQIAGASVHLVTRASFARCVCPATITTTVDRLPDVCHATAMDIRTLATLRLVRNSFFETTHNSTLVNWSRGSIGNSRISYILATTLIVSTY